MDAIEKIAIWSAEMNDEAGATAGLLKALSNAGADLQFALARRQPDKPGKGILFVSPIAGRKQEEAARNAGFEPRSDAVGVRLEGTNKAGLGAHLTEALGKAGLSLRALMANVIGKNFVIVFAFDSEADADQGIQILRRLP